MMYNYSANSSVFKGDVPKNGGRILEIINSFLEGTLLLFVNKLIDHSFLFLLARIGIQTNDKDTDEEREYAKAHYKEGNP